MNQASLQLFEEKRRLHGGFPDRALAEVIQYLDSAAVTKMISDRIEAVDFEQAKSDVVRFVRDPRDLDVWSKDYFRHVLDQLEFVA